MLLQMLAMSRLCDDVDPLGNKHIATTLDDGDLQLSIQTGCNKSYY